MRGEPETLDIDTKIIDTMLDRVLFIDMLVFTGGEPALNIPAIQYVLEQLKVRNIPVGWFFIATNGTVNQQALADMCLNYLEYVDDPDNCSLAISKDVYHDNAEAIRNSPLNALDILSDVKDYGDYAGMSMVRMGRAASSKFDDFGEFVEPKTKFEYISEYEGTTTIEDIFYVSAKGQICADCDLSFDAMETYKVGDISNIDDILEQIVKHAKIM